MGRAERRRLEKQKGKQVKTYNLKRVIERAVKLFFITLFVGS